MLVASGRPWQSRRSEGVSAKTAGSSCRSWAGFTGVVGIGGGVGRRCGNRKTLPRERVETPIKKRIHTCEDTVIIEGARKALFT